MQKREPQHIDLKKNLIGYYLAIAIILLGYILLAIGGANSFTSRTLGPIVIVVGFLFAVPIALLYRGMDKSQKTDSSVKSSRTPSSTEKSSS
jgi:flagellar motor component MotA